MTTSTQLHHLYRWETQTPDRLWLTQPMGDGSLTELTWKQAVDQARRMAAHLQSLDLPERSHIAIFSKNTAWWILSDLAIWMAGHVSIPLFPTLTPEGVQQTLEHSESKLVFVGKLDGYEAMAPGIPTDMPRITLPLAPATDDPRWDDIIARTEPLRGEPLPDPESLATIIYTSGSTGTPKGAMHSFAAMTRSAAATAEMLGIDENDRILSYLPLAHAFERWILETGALVAGYQVFFAEAIQTFVQDLQRARPTLFVSVPRLWQKFHSGVIAKMPEKKLSMLLKIPIVSGIVRRKVLTGLGLQDVRFAGCGSAPMPAELIGWYRKLGLELLEGYGMTENFIHSHISRPGQVRVGYVGQPLPLVDCRISEEGEIQVKSPGNMMGYFKDEAQTAECFTEDGYLKTGDRGEVDEIGRLKITGRVKELFKTSKGKYVSPSHIENQLLLHPDIEQACVSGSGQPQPFGMVALSEEARARLAAGAPRDEMGASIEAHVRAVNAELPGYERLAFVTVITDEWTVENGLLTPTLKLKRAAIEDKYGELVQGWYDQKVPVIWA